MALLQITCEELVAALRQQSKGFTKESSPFKGVTRHAKGKWEARIGQMAVHTLSLTNDLEPIPLS